MAAAAAVICNTVGRSQEVYRGLKEFFPGPDAGDGYPEFDLLHARYLFCDRDAGKAFAPAIWALGRESGREAGPPPRRPSWSPRRSSSKALTWILT